MKIKFKKVQFQEFLSYEVRVDGVLVGEVYRAWFRLGGNSWTHTRVAGIGYSTRLEAARYLWKAYLKTKA